MKVIPSPATYLKSFAHNKVYLFLVLKSVVGGTCRTHLKDSNSPVSNPPSTWDGEYQ